MFSSKLAVSLAIVAPLVSALTITTPSGWTSGGLANITWTAVAGDPQTFSIELVNTVFHNSFGIANNVQTGAMQITNLELPIVPPGDGYTMEFVNPGNISDINAVTGDFSIGATVSSSTSSLSSTSASGSASETSSSVSALSSGQSSSGFGTTVSGPSTTGASTGTGSSSSSTSSPSSSAFSNSGAVALGVSYAGLASYSVMAVAAFAGARLVGF
ncbi:hypothetical protein EW145_g2687 [Phellinidium pouzarii]|uniref:Ser-Thr-rich glycosyl-phosphatidyl-inositol-anchored membrane family-domain-containing protein n=1 Tax=Phellinidium pouzarii TaxID=167371 RepID=A0A4S4LAE1_9AGAM|nr:hypothetical protein EW145_g2687 [Phellinidium pouzarii]